MFRNVKPVVVCCLAAACLLVCFAGFFAPYSPAEQFRDDSFAAPNLRYYVSSQSGHVRIEFLVRGSQYKILWMVPSSVHLFGVRAPAHLFLFCTDVYGRDQFSRFLYGGQVSVSVGLLATALTVGIGAIAGLMAGFYGGWTDNLLMRSSELFLSVPWIYLLLGIRALLPLSMKPERVFLLLAAVIGVLGWARPARLVRGVIRSSKTLPFVTAAEQLGASDVYLMRRHLLPQAYSVLLAQTALVLPQFIAAEVTLSFFGLGISEPLASWGSMLASLRDINTVALYWWIGLPALALIPVFAGYQFLAQRLQQPAQGRAC